MLRLIILALVLACSGSTKRNPNTTLTVDYYGIRESVAGLGWDNPLNVERLFLGDSRPLVVIFAETNRRETKDLVSEIITKGWKDKVWIIDKDNPTSKLIETLMDAGNRYPVLAYEGQSGVKIKAQGNKAIINFLTKYGNFLIDVRERQYFD